MTTGLDWTARGNRVTNRRPAWSVAASRRSSRAWRDQLQVLTSPRRRSTAYCTRAPPSAGRSAAGYGPHRGRHDRRRTPVCSSTTRRTNGQTFALRPTSVQIHALL